VNATAKFYTGFAIVLAIIIAVSFAVGYRAGFSHAVKTDLAAHAAHHHVVQTP
jgi:hypothetical protein